MDENYDSGCKSPASQLNGMFSEVYDNCTFVQSCTGRTVLEAVYQLVEASERKQEKLDRAVQARISAMLSVVTAEIPIRLKGGSPAHKTYFEHGMKENINCVPCVASFLEWGDSSFKKDSHKYGICPQNPEAYRFYEAKSMQESLASMYAAKVGTPSREFWQSLLPGVDPVEALRTLITKTKKMRCAAILPVSSAMLQEYYFNYTELIYSIQKKGWLTAILFENRFVEATARSIGSMQHDSLVLIASPESWTRSEC